MPFEIYSLLIDNALKPIRGVDNRTELDQLFESEGVKSAATIFPAFMQGMKESLEALRQIAQDNNRQDELDLCNESMKFWRFADDVLFTTLQNLPHVIVKDPA